MSFGQQQPTRGMHATNDRSTYANAIAINQLSSSAIDNAGWPFLTANASQSILLYLVCLYDAIRTVGKNQDDESYKFDNNMSKLTYDRIRWKFRKWVCPWKSGALFGRSAMPRKQFYPRILLKRVQMVLFGLTIDILWHLFSIISV